MSEETTDTAVEAGEAAQVPQNDQSGEQAASPESPAIAESTDSDATVEGDRVEGDEAADEAGDAKPADGADAAASEGDDKAGNGSSHDDALESEGDIAADYLEELLDIADLDGDIDINVEGGRAHISIVTSGPDGDKLVGRKGEVLDALQELARLAVMTETGHRSRLVLDIAGHRDRRRKELTELAEDAIAEVKQSGEKSRLSPMNPFERKIVHDVVAAAGLTSESEGAEPQRFVVVLPA